MVKLISALNVVSELNFDLKVGQSDLGLRGGQSDLALGVVSDVKGWPE